MDFLLFIFLGVSGYPEIPDISQSPGSLCSTADKDFEEFRYPENIPYCQRNVSSALKRAIYESYHVPESERQNFTIDHIIPLSIGGSNARGNLWPEHKDVKATRPHLEQDLYDELKDGLITQNEAVDIILDEKFHR